MVSDELRSAFCMVIEEDNCVQGSQPCTQMREEAAKLLDVVGDDGKTQIFNNFGKELVSMIKALVLVLTIVTM